ncbi:hypothetical protein SLEP1_g15450 [Rubroshorea leprosula]|uniref:RRM domain-containing protein n=1 Tax=Rubroshorea leprosula TaxID=152421 RepID=A0AAV5IMC5_9ROSI|nr:hypothetical protein SLEP1_g15450 [Rubroshorea leprosula]
MRERGRPRERGSGRQRPWDQHRAQSGGRRSNRRNNGAISWYRDRQRQGYEGGYDRILYNQATVFFFTNFPDGWTYEQMWRTFLKFGRVYAIYSPQRKNKEGSRFGFVRFLDVKDARSLGRQLNQIWIGNHKLKIHPPRFNTEAKTALERKPHTNTAGDSKPSYAEVVTGVRSRGEERMTNMGSKPAQPGITINSGKTTQKWVEKRRELHWTGLEFNPKHEDWEWLVGCYVGTARSVEIVPILQERLYMEGLFSIKLRAMGAKFVLMDCDDKEELKELVESAKDWLGQWFVDVKPWSPQMVANERFVWLKCYGVPLHAWGPEFFISIANLWGNFITLDESTSSKKRFDVARILISTSETNQISKTLTYKINGHFYRIMCKEEETTNNSFSLKSDCRPVFSEEDCSESWSTDQGFGNHRVLHENDSDSASDGEDDDVTNNQAVGEASLARNSRDLSDWDSINNRFDRQQETANCSQERREGGCTVEAINENLTTPKNSNDFKILNGEIGKQADELMKQSSEQSSSGPLLLGRVSHDSRWAIEKNIGPTSVAQPNYTNLENFNRVEPNISYDGLNEEIPGCYKLKPTQTTTAVSSLNNLANPNDISKGRNVLERRLEEESGEDDEINSFWHGLASDSELIDERNSRGGRKKQRRKKKNKRAKSRSCLAVYKDSNPIEIAGVQKMGRNRPRSSKELREGVPEFYPKETDSVAGASITDSAIENCNRGFHNKERAISAPDVWNLIKEMGLGADGNEEEIINKIELMEQRDVNAKKQMLEGNMANGGEESKLEQVNHQTCRALWSTDDFDFTAMPSVGRSGGLICIWDKNVFQMNRVFCGNHYLGLFGLWGSNKTPVYLVNVYGPCDLVGRRQLWSELKTLVTKQKGNWCVMGDFNTTKNIQERVGCTSVLRSMRDFAKFIHESGLVDIPLIGRKYTWYHSSGKSMSRLDRFLMTEEWLMNWSETRQWGLRRSLSDHCPVLLRDFNINWGPKPFKCFNSWINKPGFHELVIDTWRTAEVQGWKGYCVKEKIKSVKKRLKEWSVNDRTKLDQSIAESKGKIEALDLKGEQGTLSRQEVSDRKLEFCRLWSNLKVREGQWRQKARKQWMREGDANSKFYHKCISSRQRRKEIVNVQVNGKKLEDVDEIKNGIADYFENLFKEEEWRRPNMDGIFFKQISQTQNDLLVIPFSEDEIKAAVWDCGCDKAPGPDGFNFTFFRKMWNEIKGDIVGFVQEFHKKGKLVKGLNVSFLTLIPKVKNPQRIEEFRPISLIGSLYKIIAKLLSTRLRSVMADIIGEHQMAFIEGRQLCEGVVVANEIIDEAKRKKKSSFVFKVDFEKAFDKVNWNFLDYMMMRT